MSAIVLYLAVKKHVSSEMFFIIIIIIMGIAVHYWFGVSCRDRFFCARFVCNIMEHGLEHLVHQSPVSNSGVVDLKNKTTEKVLELELVIARDYHSLVGSRTSKAHITPIHLP